MQAADRSKTALFGWELGANLGHLSAIARLVDRFTSAGFTLVFAVPDVVSARLVLPETALVIPAPVWPFSAFAGGRLGYCGYGDLLTQAGFHEPERLTAMARAWQALFALTRPDVLIADHAPAALVAARAAGLPVFSIGSPYTPPPPGPGPLPQYRADIAPALPDSRHIESAAQTAVALKSAARFTRAADLISADQSFAIGISALDPYAPLRRVALYAPPGGFTPPAPLTGDARLFAYLGADMDGVESVVQGLTLTGVPTEIYLRHANAALSHFLTRAGIRVHEKPADLRDVFSRVSHVMSHAGAMLSAEAFHAGKVHLMLPRQGEQQLNARLVEAGGGGRILLQSGTALEDSRRLRAAIEDTQLVAKARDAGTLAALRPSEDVGDALVAALGAL